MPFLEIFFLKKVLPQNWHFPIFSQLSKSKWDSGDGDVDAHREKFLIRNFAENEMAYS